MKIALFVHCFPPARGGLETLSQELYRTLRKHHEVHVFTGKGQTLDSYKTFSDWVDESGDTPDIQRRDLDFFRQRVANKLLQKIIFKLPYFSPWYFGPILRYTEQDFTYIRSADVLIGTGMPTRMIHDANRFSKQYQKPLILLPAYHNVSYFNNCQIFQNALSNAQKILFLSEKEQQDIMNHYTVDKDKTTILTYSPYTKKDITRQRKVLRQKIKHTSARICEKTITLGYVGQITQRKNLQLLARFMDTYCTMFQNYHISLHLLLAGSRTNSSQDIEILFKKHIRARRVSFQYNFPDASAIYNDIDIFLNPSFEESYGIVNIEAITHGCLSFVHANSPFSSVLGKPYTFTRPVDVYNQCMRVLNNEKTYQDAMLSQFDIVAQNTRDTFDQSLISAIESV